MPVFADRVRLVTTTAGSGTITLGSADPGFRGFAAAGLADGAQTRYVIEDGTAWEIGLGTFTAAGPTMSRTLLASSTGSLLVLSGNAKVFLTPTAFDANRWDNTADEVVAARGGFASLGALQGAQSRHSGFGPFPAAIAGQYYCATRTAAALSTVGHAANRFDLHPFVPGVAFSADQLAIEVTTLIASSLCKIVVYGSNAAGWPDTLLFEGADLDCSTTGLKASTVSLSFAADTVYWLGVRSNSNPSLRIIQLQDLRPITKGAGAGSTNTAIIRRSLAYATAAPSSFGFLASELTSGGAYLVAARAA